MAQLTDGEVLQMWRQLYRKGNGKEAFKGNNPSLSRSDLKAAFQAIEDFWQANKLTLKTAMDAAAGTTLTNAQARILGREWLRLKAQQGNN